MKPLYLIINFICLSTLVSSQCINDDLYPFDPVSSPSFVGENVIISSDQYAGDYAILENLSIGETYEITSNAVSDYISIRDPYDHSILLAHGPSPFSFTPATLDAVSMHINLISPPCGEEPTIRLTTISCTSCPNIPPAVGVNTQSPEATLHIDGEIQLGNLTRPAKAGMVRWNDNSNDFEGYNGESWISLTQANSSSWGKNRSNIVVEDQQIESSDGFLNDDFGYSVDIDGDYAVVGARTQSYGSNNSQGAAYVFHKDEASWTEQSKLTASDAATLDRFGWSVAISGDFIVVGARTADIGSNIDQGAAYVFKRNGNTWIEQEKLLATDGAGFDNFGFSVAIDGDYCIVGADKVVGGNPNQGAAYIYHRNGSAWTQQSKLVASNSSIERLGASVAIDGSYAVVGAPDSNTTGYYQSGTAIVFYRIGSAWSEDVILTSSSPSGNCHYGTSVGIDGSYIAIGETGSGRKGAVYIYNRVVFTWNEQAVLRAVVAGSVPGFGFSVDIDGDFVVAGDQLADVDGVLGIGNGFAFQRTGTIWEQKAKLIPSDGKPSDYFGQVAIDGNSILVGAFGVDVEGVFNRGKVYAFQKK